MTVLRVAKEILGVNNALYMHGDGLPAAARSIPPPLDTVQRLLIDLQPGPTSGLVPYSASDWFIYSFIYTKTGNTDVWRCLQGSMRSGAHSVGDAGVCDRPQNVLTW